MLLYLHSELEDDPVELKTLSFSPSLMEFHIRGPRLPFRVPFIYPDSRHCRTLESSQASCPAQLEKSLSELMEKDH
ncbi:hypothetical protein QTP86_012409 [Hemibagrus guttatus]|nr:hypothetical protein QTP86_012409 [Hemibagrus guttatus]